MTRRVPAQMPASLRRRNAHPARGVACPHCRAMPGTACVVRSNGRVMPQPHPARMAAWARTVACCPTCQVEPTTRCHTNGIPLNDTVHNCRYQEAEETAA